MFGIFPNEQLYHHAFFQLFSAPADVVLFAYSFATIVTKFTPNSDALGVEYYRARVVHPPGKKECTVSATSPDLRCSIFLLDEKTEYTISGSACLKDGRCSSGLEKNATTYEMRTFIDEF